MPPAFHRSTIILVIILILGGISVAYVRAQQTMQPLSNSELMALVAGNALSEDIVKEIGSRGLTFRPSDQYQSLIATAGGDTLVLGALKNAKAPAQVDGTGNDEADQRLQQLAMAGKLIRSKQYEDAALLLTAVLQSG